MMWHRRSFGRRRLIPRSRVASLVTADTQRQPAGVEAVRLDADIMSAAYKGLPRGKQVGTPNAPAVEVCPWANSHGGCIRGCMSGNRPRDESECSRAHCKKGPREFDRAAHALMAGRGGHWKLPEVKGYAARQQLATGYALAHRASVDGRQLATRNDMITAGQASRHRALGGVPSGATEEFSLELEEDYHSSGHLAVANTPWVVSDNDSADVELSRALVDGYEEARKHRKNVVFFS